MLVEVIQAAAERGLGRVHREPNQPRYSPSRSARRAGHEGGHRNGSGRSGGNRRAVAEAAGERGDRNPGGADRTGRRANRARTALATSPLTKRTSAVSLSGLVFASTMSSPRARSLATRSSRASATCLPNAAMCSTARASRSTCAHWSAARRLPRQSHPAAQAHRTADGCCTRRRHRRSAPSPRQPTIETASRP